MQRPATPVSGGSQTTESERGVPWSPPPLCPFRMLLNSTFEDVLGMIPVSGVRNHGLIAIAPTKALGNLNCGKDVGSSARSAEHTFFARQIANGGKCVLIGDHDDFIARLPIEGLRNKADANSFYFMLTRRTALEHGALCLHC